MTYRQTFRKHRRLLTMPILVTVVLALWVVAGSPKKYESSSSLWVDNPAPLPSSLTETDTSLRTPADQQQLLIQELLQTRDFRLAVGRKSPLARYLAGNPASGWGPSALLGGLGGSKPLDARIIDELGPKHVTATIAGPQVLQLTYRGASPAVVADTLRVLVNEYNAQLSKLSVQRNESALSYYRAKVDSASKGVADAKRGVDDFLRAHPGTPTSDPHLKALLRTQKAAAPALARATSRLNTAASSTKQDGSPETALSVIDPPRVPTGPLSGKKLLVMALFGGLFAGGLLSLLGLIALTPSKPDVWDAGAAQSRQEAQAPLAEPEELFPFRTTTRAALHKVGSGGRRGDAS